MATRPSVFPGAQWGEIAQLWPGWCRLGGPPARWVCAVGVAREQRTAGQGNRVILSSRKGLAAGGVREREPGRGSRGQPGQGGGQPAAMGAGAGSGQTHGQPPALPHLLHPLLVVTYCIPGPELCAEQRKWRSKSPVYFFLGNYSVPAMHSLSVEPLNRSVRLTHGKKPKVGSERLGDGPEVTPW